VNPVGLFRKSSSKAWHEGHGIRELFLKKSAHIILSLRRGEATVALQTPRNSVQVNDPSGLGSAIIMKLFRGQM
jgi:hypothetical protein